MERKKMRPRLSNAERDEWLLKICQILQSKKVYLIFKKLKKNFGDCEPIEDRTGDELEDYFKIRINPRRGGFFNTLIHEVLHAIDYDMSHRRVRWLSGQLVKRMTMRQYAHLITALAKGLRRHDRRRLV